MDRLFAGLGDKQLALDANVVADVDEVVERPLELGDFILSDVNLDAGVAVAEVSETGFAHEAVGDDAPGKADVFSFFESF